MPKFLIAIQSPTCHHGTSLKLAGNPLSGPSTLTVSCSVCGKPGTIDSFQSVDKLPMLFGTHRSFYEANVEQSQATLILRPNCPIYREALKIDWQEDLDGKTGEAMLPILKRAVADLEARAAYYRSMNDRDWFGFESVLGFLKQAISAAKANPNQELRLRLDIRRADT